jgi:hypothetical protein
VTLPSSGPIALSDIQTEFGGSNPISLSEYYAGGAYVPAGTTGTYGAVPSSGAISIHDFYGTTKGYSTFTVTVGYATDGSNDFYGFKTLPVSTGSISPTPAYVTIFGGAILSDCAWTLNYISGLTFVAFTVSGDQTATAWTSVTIAGTVFTKASSSYITYDSGTNTTTVSWASPSTNPFGTTVGATKSVVFA